MLIGGLATLVAGVALLSVPAALIVGGGALVALALSEALDWPGPMGNRRPRRPES